MVNAVMAAVLLVLLVVRRNYRACPAFFVYILVNFVLGFLVFFIYRRWAFISVTAWRIGWGLQGIVICARALAVAELCRLLLARYRGIWALAWRLLLACAALVLLNSVIAASHSWTLAVPTADRGLELSIATVIVVLLLFARYYQLEASPLARSLAIGFCLYSCFSVLNDTILERLLYHYYLLWNLVGMLAFLLSLLVWTWAFRHTVSQAPFGPALLCEFHALPLRWHCSRSALSPGLGTPSSREAHGVRCWPLVSRREWVAPRNLFASNSAELLLSGFCFPPCCWLV